MRRLYLLLAVIGAIVPYIGFIDFMRTDGAGLGGFFSAWFANGAVSGLSADLVLSSICFAVFMVNRRGPNPLPFVALNLLIGLSCALPAYLYVITSRQGEVALDKASAAV